MTKESSEYSQAVAARDAALAEISTWPAWMRAGAQFATTQLTPSTQQGAFDEPLVDLLTGEVHLPAALAADSHVQDPQGEKNV